MSVGVVIYTVVFVAASRRDEIVELIQYILFQPFFILVEHQRSRGVWELNDEQAIFYAGLLCRLQHLVGEVYYISFLATREIELFEPSFHWNPIFSKLATHKKRKGLTTQIITSVENMKVWIVMPANNEERMMGRVLDSLKREGWRNVVVVDDGSIDRTADIARSKGAVVVRHKRNMGLGAALRTGLATARKRGADCAVTFDADGQHDPKAVRRLVEALKGADLVIGVRKHVGIPMHKRFGNFFLNCVTYLFSGMFTDSQSGSRAFNRRALEKIKIRSNRYEVSSEIIVQARKRGLKVGEAPVKCFYTKYTKARGTNIASGFKIFWGLLKLKVTG